MRSSAGELYADLRECLRRYLDEHPDAADSLPGIRQWWLPDRLRNQALNEDLEAALQQLVELGKVQRNVLPDGNELYTRAGLDPTES